MQQKREVEALSKQREGSSNDNEMGMGGIAKDSGVVLQRIVACALMQRAEERLMNLDLHLKHVSSSSRTICVPRHNY